MSNINGAGSWELYLQNYVLRYYRMGVVYHQGIIQLIKRKLREMDVEVWSHWGILIDETYEHDEGSFVAEVLRAHEGDKASDRPYDRYSDEEEQCHEHWNGGMRDINAIAREIQSKYPNTKWFDNIDPATMVEWFLYASGHTGNYEVGEGS
ncbi:hypothetical protein K432DRAFT_389962 [Lepidopterella palustris CBS 459.81]|uniref:Uncharacterized protein n=1 Tax=Lepidopterella palustris CBS 459.81 TaxID=1314670 RepID=A0A8E2JIV6_9PEZI|nr:hypothetical protein K432DRAFT_389962 [Lepidopterella palustris CBS 459.81]